MDWKQLNAVLKIHNGQLVHFFLLLSTTGLYILFVVYKHPLLLESAHHLLNCRKDLSSVEQSSLRWTGNFWHTALKFIYWGSVLPKLVGCDPQARETLVFAPLKGRGGGKAMTQTPGFCCCWGEGFFSTYLRQWQCLGACVGSPTRGNSESLESPRCYAQNFITHFSTHSPLGSFWTRTNKIAGLGLRKPLRDRAAHQKVSKNIFTHFL